MQPPVTIRPSELATHPLMLKVLRAGLRRLEDPEAEELAKALDSNSSNAHFQTAIATQLRLASYARARKISLDPEFSVTQVLERLQKVSDLFKTAHSDSMYQTKKGLSTLFETLNLDGLRKDDLEELIGRFPENKVRSLIYFSTYFFRDLTDLYENGKNSPVETILKARDITRENFMREENFQWFESKMPAFVNIAEKIFGLK